MMWSLLDVSCSNESLTNFPNAFSELMSFDLKSCVRLLMCMLYIQLGEEELNMCDYVGPCV